MIFTIRVAGAAQSYFSVRICCFQEVVITYLALDHFVGAPRSLSASVWSLEHVLGTDPDLHDQGRRYGAELLLRKDI